LSNRLRGRVQKISGLALRLADVSVIT